MIPFKTIEGAVAILRQLNSFLHLETQAAIYKVVINYLPNIWILNKNQEETLVNQVGSETQLMLSLESLLVKVEKKVKSE